MTWISKCSKFNKTMVFPSISVHACYEKVLDWFNETFPYYGGPYEFNADHKIVGPKAKADNVTPLPETKSA